MDVELKKVKITKGILNQIKSATLSELFSADAIVLGYIRLKDCEMYLLKGVDGIYYKKEKMNNIYVRNEYVFYKRGNRMISFKMEDSSAAKGFVDGYLKLFGCESAKFQIFI